MAKVKVGFFSFTEVTDPSEHRAYNEWHQLDHMPEQFPLEGIAYGQRWVSTPACRAARAVSEPPLDAIHYVTLYLIAEPVERTLREFRQLGKDLYAAGRFHQKRHAHLSGPFPLIATAAAERVLISAEAVPYRPHQGVHVVVRNRAHTTDLAQLCAAPGVAGAWEFANDERTITVAWLDASPLDTAANIASDDDGVVFAGPFETIIPREWAWFDER